MHVRCLRKINASISSFFFNLICQHCNLCCFLVINLCYYVILFSRWITIAAEVNEPEPIVFKLCCYLTCRKFNKPAPWPTDEWIIQRKEKKRRRLGLITTNSNLNPTCLRMVNNMNISYLCTSGFAELINLYFFVKS